MTGIQPYLPLEEAVVNLREYLHKWPGLLVTQGDGKILVKMRNKLSIYVPKQWNTWQVQVTIEDWKTP